MFGGPATADVLLVAALTVATALAAALASSATASRTPGRRRWARRRTPEDHRASASETAWSASALSHVVRSVADSG
jgi:hypothetical protein